MTGVFFDEKKRVMEKSNDQNSGPDRNDEKFQTLVGKTPETARNRRRKQENPQRKKIEATHSTRGEKKKIPKKKPLQKGRGGEKNRKVDKIINVAETEVSNATIQGAAKLTKQKLSGLVNKGNEEKSFEREIHSFEKNLTFIHDVETLRLVWYLVYLICKEKNERSLFEHLSSSK